MTSTRSTALKMRVFHRYLGFFLTGIMAVYALSGIVLIFRNTDYFKKTNDIEKTVATDLNKADLGKALKIRNLKVDREAGAIYYYKNGTYNKTTGVANYQVKKLPFVLDKMTHLHKAKSSEPLFFLNIFFGVALLFFVISAFWMYLPGTSIFKKGMYFTVAGIALTLLLLFI